MAGEIQRSLAKRSVFISFARADKDSVRKIELALKEAGFESLQPSLTSTYSDSVSHLAKIADCVVVVWSVASSQSAWVAQEIKLALDAWSTDRLVLASLDETPLPVGLRDLLTFDLRDFRPENIETFVRHVAKLAAPKARPNVALQSNATASRLRWYVGYFILALFFVSTIPFSLVMLRSPLPDPIPSPPIGNDTDLFQLGVFTFGLLYAAIGFVVVWYGLRKKRTERNAASDLESPPRNHASSADVFISYSSIDISRVEPVVSIIEQIGHTAWIDRGSTGSARYAAKISYAIRNSRIFALMCSEKAFRSDHVIRKIYLAGQFKKPFIAIRLDSSDIPDEAEYFLTGYPRIQVSLSSDIELTSYIKNALKR